VLASILAGVYIYSSLRRYTLMRGATYAYAAFSFTAARTRPHRRHGRRAKRAAGPLLTPPHPLRISAGRLPDGGRRSVALRLPPLYASSGRCVRFFPPTSSIHGTRCRRRCAAVACTARRDAYLTATFPNFPNSSTTRRHTPTYSHLPLTIHAPFPPNALPQHHDVR